MKFALALTALLGSIPCLAGCGGGGATATGGGPAPSAQIDCSQPNVTFVYQDRSYRLGNTCYDYDELKTAQGELLFGPDKGTPDVSLWGCGEGVMVSLFGHATALPGALNAPVVKVRMPGDPDERPSVSASIEITSMGAPGDMIAGTFEGVMSPKLNEAGVPVRGTMCVKRVPDRARP